MIEWLIFVRSNEQYQKTFELLRYNADLSTGPKTVIEGSLKLRNGRMIETKVKYLLGLRFYGSYGEDYIINNLPENLWQGDDNKAKEIKSLDCVLKPKSELIGNYIEHLWSHTSMNTKPLK